MATPAQIAARLASDINGIAVYVDLTQATSKLKVLSLLNIVSAQGTLTQRGHLDEMSPAAHIQLVAELTALWNNLAN